MNLRKRTDNPMDRQPYRPRAGGRPWTAAMRVAAVAAFAVCCGCGDKLLLTSRYDATDLAPENIGRGLGVRLEVVDARWPRWARLGVTKDEYREAIYWDEPVRTIVEEAFRSALGRAGYQVRDAAAVAYRVSVGDVTVAAAYSTEVMTQADVSLVLEIERAGQTVATKPITGSESASHEWSKSPTVDAERCLSAALSKAVDGAVADKDLQAALDGDRSTGASAP